jgi:hypothetical protein
MSKSSEFDHGTEHKATTKKRHKMVKFTTNGGVNLGCEHCDTYSIAHPTDVSPGLGNKPVTQWHYTDKQGMKEAWEAHKAANS